MISTLNWMADAVLAALLAGTLVMALRLDRALRVVRSDRSVFEGMITNLSAATAAVKSGIQALRIEAEQAADLVGRRSEEADKMATDLSFLIEAADRAGARLEGRIPTVGTKAEVVAKVVQETPAPKAARKPRKKRPATRVVPASDAEEAPSSSADIGNYYLEGPVVDLQFMAGVMASRGSRKEGVTPFRAPELVQDTDVDASKRLVLRYAAPVKLVL